MCVLTSSVYLTYVGICYRSYLVCRCYIVKLVVYIKYDNINNNSPRCEATRLYKDWHADCSI